MRGASILESSLTMNQTVDIGINTSALALELMGARKRASKASAVFDAVLAAQRMGLGDDFTISEVRRLMPVPPDGVVDTGLSGRISELVSAGRLVRTVDARTCRVTGALCRPVFVPAHQVRLAGV